MYTLPFKDQIRVTTLLTQPHRHYHNTTHVMDCLAEFQQFTKVVPIENDVEILVTHMIWYHDVVYNPYALPGENERESAEIGEAEYPDDGRGSDYIQLNIKNGILATAHHTETQEMLTWATQIMLDIDLSGLGKDWVIYKKNSDNVRKEHYNTFDYQFAQGRIAFLEAMLKRDCLYYTEYFFNKYEQPARFNMKNERDCWKSEYHL